jgi:FKBP-type peptidyl-prolyl cis-trans isomerase SlyD
MTTPIEKNSVVSMNYTLRDEAQKILDASQGDPLTYLHGHGNIIKGLEEALAGLIAGAKKSVTVEPADGYGEYQDAMLLEIPRSQFPAESRLVEGEVFELYDENEDALIGRIIKTSDETITLDANHPLAGQRLFFEIEIVSVRPASAEELEHGHAHGADGEHHDH